MKRGLFCKPLNCRSVYSFLPNKMNKIKSMKLGLPNNLSHAGQTVLFWCSSGSKSTVWTDVRRWEWSSKSRDLYLERPAPPPWSPLIFRPIPCNIVAFKPFVLQIIAVRFRRLFCPRHKRQIPKNDHNSDKNKQPHNYFPTLKCAKSPFSMNFKYRILTILLLAFVAYQPAKRHVIRENDKNVFVVPRLIKIQSAVFARPDVTCFDRLFDIRRSAR